MPVLNLIHEKRQAIRRDEKKAKMFFIAFAAISSVSTLAFMGLQLDVANTRGAQVAVQKKIDRTKPLQKQIEQNKKDFDDLSPFVKALSEARDNSNRWSRFLTHLSKQTPNNLYLTQMRSNQTDPTKPVTISIMGNAKDNEAVGEFLLRIANSFDVEQARFQNTTSPKPVGTTTLYGFEIAVDLAGTAHQPEMKKDGGENKGEAK